MHAYRSQTSDEDEVFNSVATVLEPEANTWVASSIPLEGPVTLRNFAMSHLAWHYKSSLDVWSWFCVRAD